MKMKFKLILYFTILSALTVKNLEAQVNSKQSINESLNDSIIEIFNNCNCVETYQCDINNYIIQDGTGLINFRGSSNEKPKARIHCSNTRACCFFKTNTTTTLKEPKIPIAPKIFKKTHKLLCGMQRPIFDVRIVALNDDASSSINGEFPWVASIYQEAYDGTFKFKCAGSLIHPQVVVTVNHCLLGLKEASLRVKVNGKSELGEINTNSDEQSGVTEIVRHPEYYSGGLYNDIALVFLEKEFNPNKTLVNTICLPHSNMNFDELKCFVTGWGKGTTNAYKVLSKQQIPLIQHNECQKLLRRTRLRNHFELHESFLCAGGEEGRDACVGDGGGPLMCKVDHQYYLVGMVAWGIDCGMADVPGVYSNVIKLNSWIVEEINKKQFVIN